MISPVVCALCRSTADLRDSHIIPKFMIRHIRETSATGRLRRLDNLARRHQDGIKLRLLCDACEGRFNAHETWFASDVFRPTVAETGRPTLHHRSLLPFVVSLAWRCAQADGERLARKYPSHAEAIHKAMEQWRRYLLSPDQAPGQHYLFNLSAVYVLNGPDWTNWYIRRAYDFAAVLWPTTYSRPMLWWKGPGIAGLSMFGGPGLIGVESFRVRRTGLAKEAWSASIPGQVSRLVILRASAASDRLNDMPQHQRDAIARDYDRSFDQWVDTQAAEVAALDILNRDDDP